MDIGGSIEDAIDYTRQGLWGHWRRWILLAVSTIIFPLIAGYAFWILKGVRPAPELQNWGRMFIDGIRLLVVMIIYYIPIWIVMAVFIGPALSPLISALGAGNIGAVFAILGRILIGLIIVFILEIIIYIVLITAAVRYARTDAIGEAFRFGAIFDHIAQIGWAEYILALIVLWLVTIVVPFVFGIIGSIPLIGWLIVLFLYPAYIIFIARYVALLHDSAKTFA
ncbi:MAG: DUF4013 domain-containing protein [Methanomicrobiaceae archaeon]|nr:DUF4013 domain-containing protein [Methanomicrobiaceae archaeon]